MTYKFFDDSEEHYKIFLIGKAVELMAVLNDLKEPNFVLAEIELVEKNIELLENRIKKAKEAILKRSVSVSSLSPLEIDLLKRDIFHFAKEPFSIIVDDNQVMRIF